MRLDSVKIYSLSLPFSIPFSHALKHRFSANNIAVEVSAGKGELRGYGEGAPRPYVTGESQGSALIDAGRLVNRPSFPWNLEEPGQIWDYIDSLPPGKIHHSTTCAIETALLDILARSREKSINDFFSKDFYTGNVVYGSAIPLGDGKVVKEFGRRIRELGINRVKLKLGRNIEESRSALKAISMVFGNDYDLKIDVNMAWNREQTMAHLPLLQAFRVSVLEQPLVPCDPDINLLAPAIREAGIQLMADESVCTLGELERVMEEGHYRMVNIRLSKCGGFRKCLEMIEYLRSGGTAFQIGCHLGESGILSAAGRALSLLCGDARYHDGSYDAFLLRENVTDQPVSFGKGGIAEPLKGPGLGVEIDRDRLLRLSGGRPRITILRP
ncbi:MAG: hypothetical protein JRH13_05790 [Deltaproteobacteria bacterium]|nr:hypothetical protein [Deltaproteobacteria bacterium]MBW2304444.1 hypothetical protein [Deltaproteobacteria bacterium]